MKHFLAITLLLSMAISPALAQNDIGLVEQTPEQEAMVKEQLELSKKANKSDIPINLGAPARVEAEALKKSEALSVDKNTKEERLELSQEMHKIWPIRQKVENALDSISERIPEKDRLKFKSGMRRAIDFDALEKASIDAMADIYTVAELEKMIEFYGSKEGRSISVKTGDYEKSLQPLMVKMVDKALLDAKMGTPKSGAQSHPR